MEIKIRQGVESDADNVDDVGYYNPPLGCSPSCTRFRKTRKPKVEKVGDGSSRVPSGSGHP
mgnify:CR=1 FL=1